MTQVFGLWPDDVMVVALGTGAGALPPLRALKVDLRMTLPNERLPTSNGGSSAALLSGPLVLRPLRAARAL